MQQSIRGAITVSDNTENEIRVATKELLDEIIQRNNLDVKLISNVIFTMTKDLDKVYPAKVARELFNGFDKVPMMCVQELYVENSLSRCIRVMITVNTEKSQNEMKHIYLRDAKNLRIDING